MKPQEHTSGAASPLEPPGPDAGRLTQVSQKTTAKPDVGNQVKKHTISILVENKFGAFTRIAGLFAAKGYNIDSLSVGPTEEQDTSRMTIVTHGDDQIIEQIIKQLNKLIESSRLRKRDRRSCKLRRSSVRRL
jgi:acetolactate synthase regulatory subunit